MKKVLKVALLLSVLASCLLSCSHLFEDDEDVSTGRNGGGVNKTTVDGREVDHAPNAKLKEVLNAAGLLPNVNGNIPSDKMPTLSGKTFDGFNVRMPDGTIKYVQINPDGSFVVPADKEIEIPVGTTITPVFLAPGQKTLKYTIIDANGKECVVPVIVEGTSTASAKWSVIKKAAKNAGVNVGDVGPGGSHVTGWKHGSGDYSSGTDISGDLDIPEGNEIGPVLTAKYNVNDGTAPYPATFENVTYPDDGQTLKDIFGKIYTDASNKDNINAKIKTNYPSISDITQTDFEQGKSVTAPVGKAFGGWKVTTPDGTVKIVKPSEIASAGKFPVGTKIEPSWIDSPSLSLGGGVNIDFTKIDGGGELYGTLVGDFYIANTEITRAQWKAVMLKDGGDEAKNSDWHVNKGAYMWKNAKNTGNITDMTMPMNFVSWYDAILFCNVLSRKDNRRPYYTFSHDASKCQNHSKHAGDVPTDDEAFLEKYYTATANEGMPDPDKVSPSTDTNNEWLCIVVKEDTGNTEGFRIPTAVYWEYAARGGKDGKSTKYSGTTGTNNTALSEVAWWSESSKVNGKNEVHPVGLKGGDNPVRDMTGNVNEWCWDLFQVGRRLYIGGAYNAPANLQDITNREVYNQPGGSGGYVSQDKYNRGEGYAGSTGDRSPAMGIRLVVPILPR